MSKKGQQNEKNIFFVLNKYQSVILFYIFQGLFKNIVFRSVHSYSHKKVMGYFRLFSCRPDFFPPYKWKKIFNKKSFKLLFIKCQSISRCQKWEC